MYLKEKMPGESPLHSPREEGAPAITKLSEAIRIGARMTPQVLRRSEYFDCGGTCAIGAAAVALYGPSIAKSKSDEEWFHPIVERFGMVAVTEAVGLFYRLPTREAVADTLEAMGY